jgi:apolipoprotein N-acyltransferase
VRGRIRWPWHTLLAAAGGLVLVLAFPAYGLVGLAPLGPAALALAVRGQRVRSGLWLGLVFGLAFFVPLLSWSGIYVGPVPWLALAGWEAVQLALLGGATALTSRLRLWPVWAAALWVADEALRGRFVLGGFPWGRLGFSQTDGPLLALAAYGGVPLVSFAVALTGTLLAWAGSALVSALVRARRSASDAGERGPAVRTAALAVAAVLAVPLAGALAWLPLPGPSLTDGGPAATVAVIQGDVPRAGLDFNAQRRAVLDNHVQRTLELAEQVAAGERPRPDVVIWPENSSDIDPYLNTDADRQISRAAEAIDAPILVGAIVQGPGRYISNTAIVWDPGTGPGDTYIKRHPVPFGEYVPARSFVRLFSEDVDRVHDQYAGREVGVLDIGGIRLGDLICFEVVYDGLVGDVVDGGAGMLVVQTNNATFGYTDESAQQLALSRLRAVEFGRSVVIAATSGISAVVAPDGSVARSSQLFTPDVFVEEIAQRDSTTVAQRLGAAPEWVLAAVGAAALVAAARPSLLRRRGRSET